METSHEVLLRTQVKADEGGGQQEWKGSDGFETVLRCDKWDLETPCSAEKLLHILTLFTLPSSTSLQLNLAFP